MRSLTLLPLKMYCWVCRWKNSEIGQYWLSKIMDKSSLFIDSQCSTRV